MRITRRLHSIFALACLVFVQLPNLAGGENQELYLAFFGDSGTGGRKQKEVSIQLNRVAEQEKLDYVFMLGDNIYPEGETKHFKSKFFDVYRKLFAKNIPFHAALGNHDVKECDVVTKNPLPPDATAYEHCDVVQHLREPRFGYEGRKRYYSVTLPGEPPVAEIFVLDTNTLAIRDYLDEGLPEDSAQIGWLERALGESKAVWKIVTMHNAMHTPHPATFLGIQGHRPEYGLQDQLHNIFRRYGVDAVFQGHNHFYARLLPQDGIRYFVAGGGGKRPYKHKREPGYVAPDEERGKFNHFVHVRLTGESFQYCTIDSDGQMRDGGAFQEGDRRDRAFIKGCPF